MSAAPPPGASPGPGGAAPPGRGPGAGPGPPGIPPLPPGLFPPGLFPPGVDPVTWRVEEVTRQLRRAAYLPIFSVPDPGRVNRPVPLLPGLDFLMVAVEVHEQLHRFQVHGRLGPCGLEVGQRVGGPAATVHIRWTPIPDGYAPAPDRRPPTTVLNPFVSQRFTMLDGEMSFDDGAGSGFHGFGAGRTFPVRVAGKRRLRLAAVIDVLEGFGAFAGLPGTVVVNGYIEPPHGLALNMMLRLVDLDGRLEAGGPLAPLVPVADPDPDALFLVVLGEPDPERGTELEIGPGGGMSGARVYERLRLVDLGFELGAGGPRCHTRVGEVAGDLAGRLYFDPMALLAGGMPGAAGGGPSGAPPSGGSPSGAPPSGGSPPGVVPAPAGPVPFQTRDGVFVFRDADGCALGTLDADVVEGRAFPLPLPGAPLPAFRFGGFGPVRGGSGVFAGAAGMMTLNAAISVFPRTLSNLYVFRLADPGGRLRVALGGPRA